MVRFVFCGKNSGRYVCTYICEVREREAGACGATDYGNEPGEYGWSSTCPWCWGGEKGLEGHLERRLTGLGDYPVVKMREKEET